MSKLHGNLRENIIITHAKLAKKSTNSIIIISHNLFFVRKYMKFMLNCVNKKKIMGGVPCNNIMMYPFFLCVDIIQADIFGALKEIYTAMTAMNSNGNPLCVVHASRG